MKYHTKYIFMMALMACTSNDGRLYHMNGSDLQIYDENNRQVIKVQTGGEGRADCEMRIAASEDGVWKLIPFETDTMEVRRESLEKLYVVVRKGEKYIDISTDFDDKICSVGTNMDGRYLMK